tara:strand:+ start:1097 stop:1603 length:507 start_codon:yes stop_codon:yes gene_type:complete
MTSRTNASVTPSIKLIYLLGYAGLMPFVISLWLMLDELWLGSGEHSDVFFVAYAPYLFITYSGVILSFMSGTLWASWHTISNISLARLAVLMSNLLALSAWSTLLWVYITPAAAVWCVILLMFGFMSLLWVERLMGGVSSAYWRMRLSLTGIVMMLHLVMIMLLLLEF